MGCVKRMGAPAAQVVARYPKLLGIMVLATLVHSVGLSLCLIIKMFFHHIHKKKYCKIRKTWDG
jgi:hypothetical protein